MLTTRGFWFLVFVLLFTALGIRLEIVTLGVVGLTLLLWFLWEWLLFALRVYGLVRYLHLDRQLGDERGAVQSLWAGQSFDVRVRLWLERAAWLPYVKVTDRVPFSVDQVRGPTELEGPVSRHEPLEWSYRVHCPGPGRIRFEGAALQMADLQGFFYHETFLARPQVYRVLPPLADARGRVPAAKRHNLLPLLGIHRHRRPGSGSELLDLRDYIPGDPPKTIAWKPSARRDRLMTKEFESEVPVRCTLFVDTSASVRIGAPGQSALARLVEVSSTVAQASAGARDLTGLCLFDEHQSSTIRPARGARHLIQMLNRLADAAGLAPSTGEARLRPLLRLGYGLAKELYPDRLERDINASPWWLPWLWPQPVYNIRRPSGADRFDRWLWRILLTGWGLVFAYLAWTVERSYADAPADEENLFGRFILWALSAGLAGFGFVVTYFFLRVYLLFMPARRRFFHRRKRLAALLSVRYGLAPGGLALLMEDDGLMIQYAQRFLADHHVPYPLPLYDRGGRYLFAAPGKIPVLAAALLRAVGKGHDNELFVLLVDLLELEDHLGPLLQAVRVARGRHHRVLVICPWPPGIRPPTGTADEADGRERIPPPGDQENSPALGEVLYRTTTSRFHRAFQQMRRTFARMGVQVLCARDRDPARLILQRMDQLRLLERKK
jgi:uncharacterized protein (DUF58 family)